MSNKTYQEYLSMISERIKDYRINSGYTQQDIEHLSGVSVRSISRFEQGGLIQLDNLIKVLIALDLDQNLEMLIPDQTKRPSYYLKENKKAQRVRNKNEVNHAFKWGDEK